MAPTGEFIAIGDLMTQPPPDMEAYEEEVRRRVAASNYAPAANSTSPGDGPPTQAAIEPQTVTIAGTSNPVRNSRRTVILAIAMGVMLSLVTVAFMCVPIIVDQAKGLSQKEVEAVIAEGPPFADSLTATQMYDAYISMKRDGSIYRIIPDTDDGRRYFRAFMYAVTDVKIAESIAGGLSSDEKRDLAEREQLFLALEDLDIDIDITHTDGTQELLNGLPPQGA